MIEGFAAKSAKERLEPMAFEPPPLGDFDIEVKISHCGLCHSDLHLIDDDWHVSKYPLLPGHEIVGQIVRKGKHVLGLELGERVGIGWQENSCGHCNWCRQGEENLCLSQQPTCIGRFGGFAQSIVANHRFAFPIPDTLKSENAAPLLCGGATVFSPLLQQGIDSTHRVGVYGIGGLGHLAIQFARAFGCEVFALSSSEGKREEALKLGATHFLGAKDLSPLKGQLDLILFTSSQTALFPQLVETLRPKGKLCLLGAPAEGEVRVPIFQLIDGRKTVCGSNIASPAVMLKMLDFAARHNIVAQTELFPMREINTALDKLRANRIHYRAVLFN